MAGKLDRRLEAAIDLDMDAAIAIEAEKLAGGGKPHYFRSAAARLLLQRGIDATPGLGKEAERRARQERKTATR